MHSDHRKNPFGILYIIIGTIIFLLAAGEFLIRLLFAGLALWLISYGLQCMTGRSNVIFWGKWPR